MALDDDIRILSGVSLFEGFTREQLRLLAFGAESPQAFSRQRSVSRKERRPIRAMSWCAGASSSTASATASASTVGHAGPGAMLGELALIADTTQADFGQSGDRHRLPPAEPQAVPPHPRGVSRTGRDAARADRRRAAGDGRSASESWRRASGHKAQNAFEPVPSRWDRGLYPFGCRRFRGSTFRDHAYSRSKRAITGTWSDGRSQPRAARRISMPVRRPERFADDQIWSSRRPRSDSAQSRAR